MRGRMVVWTVAVAAMALVSTARAGHEGSMLDAAGLKKQAAQNKALARYLKYNGMPEMAEVRPIVDQPPWDDHEVTLYYLGARKEISFARARVLGRPEVNVSRYERTLTDADVRTLKSHGTLVASASSEAAAVPAVCTGSAAERAECAAGRAESAADRIDVAAVRAEKAAERTEAIVEKMSAPKPAPRHRQAKKAPAPTETQPDSAS
jgi:hypothetical protein